MTQVSERILILDGASLPGREQVGNKAASIAQMRALGLPVPPAFVLPIDECRRYHAAGGELDAEAWAAVRAGIEHLERETGRSFGDPASPLLVSVRSAAAISMPGMMDTVLNLGMTDALERGLAALSGDPGFARDTHARFCHEFGHIVLGADVDPGDDPAAVCAAVLKDTGQAVPGDPWEQLRAAIHAVFGSWSSRRAVAYRRHWGIPEDGGTAVVVQAMAFGNLGGRSGTGVVFTRNPLTGAPEVYGEWLAGGQGEDVVSGTHDPRPVAELAEQLPELHAELMEAAQLLESERGDMQDIEFTIEAGRLYLLQTRTAKRSPLAAVRIAADLVREGVTGPEAALRQVSPEQVQAVLAPTLAPDTLAGAEVLARGTPACPGVSSGRAAPDARAGSGSGEGGPVVLVRPTTSPEDVDAMVEAVAVVTERGGATSHAAVVTRALGRPSVVGVGDGVTGGWVGSEVTVDGSGGVVYAGRLPTRQTDADDVPGLAELLGWARERSPVTVGEGVDEVRDLDGLGLRLEPDHPVDAATLEAGVHGARAVRGTVLNSPEGARAAIVAGVKTVVPLPGQRPEVLLLRLAQAGLED
ncbi:MAG TPA: pyruvate, phosphate dikinase [Solirubrobacteraceae bacterium]|nr:pyruvate, phosphate dikinase [Solirubrobacteraceae bacterium]